MTRLGKGSMTVYDTRAHEIAREVLPAGRSRWLASVRVDPQTGNSGPGICRVRATFDMDAATRRAERLDAEELGDDAPVRVRLEERGGRVCVMVSSPNGPAMFTLGVLREIRSG